jgi:hypothetical protein
VRDTMQAQTARVEEFRRFLSLAEPFLRVPMHEFEGFLMQSREILLRGLPERLQEIQPSAEKLRPWLISADLDLLRIGGVTHDENAYTELLAWALRPSTHPETALDRQRTWLCYLDVPGAGDLIGATEPKTQLRTKHGIPDLVLVYPSFAVVIEAKTSTSEHFAAGSGEYQTIAYPEGVKKELSLAPELPVFMVFLTLEGTKAQNDCAIETRYVDYALGSALALDPSRFAEPYRTLFAAWFTHLIAEASPQELRLLDAIEPILRWRGLESESLLEWVSEIDFLAQATSG